MAQEPTIHALFETTTGTWQYIVADPATSTAAIIDPVLDYDPATHTITSTAADGLLSMIQEKEYHISHILETHAHADHLTAAAYLAHRLAQTQGSRPPLICIGKRITQVQQHFGKAPLTAFFVDDETFSIGELTVVAMHLPGHTPDHLGYQIGDNIFCGDSLFHADLGTARCDFPAGNSVRVWTGHDYPHADRTQPVPWLTVRDHKERNKHVNSNVTEAEFLALRRERDAGLGEPRLLNPALQVNIRAGRVPRMLVLPVKLEGEVLVELDGKTRQPFLTGFLPSVASLGLTAMSAEHKILKGA
ncbi:hypothetical protein BDV12DRAFT_190162 [Aspergillus spectabilis]